MWGKPKIAEETIQCSLVNSPIIYIEATPKHKIQLLMNEYTHQEWLAYLKGRISEKSNIFVEDISIPPHASASGGEAEAEPFHIPKDCVGVIHSHHGMGAFHSGTDQAYVDKNFPVSITVARSNSELVYDAVSYSQTPCGKSVTTKCSVKYVQPQPTFDKDKFLKKAKGNIDKGRRIYQPVVINRGTPYVPVRHRLSGLGDVIIGADGHVLSQREMEDLAHYSVEW